MTTRETEERQKQIELVQEKIDAYGCAIVRNRESTIVPYGYTAGLSEKYLPELIMFGHEKMDLISVLLNHFATIWMRGRRPEMGVIEGLIRDSNGNPSALKLQVVVAAAASTYMPVASELYHKKHLTVVQVMWADLNGRFPDEEGYDSGEWYRQPVLPALTAADRLSKHQLH